MVMAYECPPLDPQDALCVSLSPNPTHSRKNSQAQGKFLQRSLMRHQLTAYPQSFYTHHSVYINIYIHIDTIMCQVYVILNHNVTHTVLYSIIM